jgi:lysine-N-methylase
MKSGVARPDTVHFHSYCSVEATFVMAFPVYHLPVFQNWDCQASGNCCREYRINLTEEEHRRIESQGWDKEKDLEGYSPFRSSGWRKRRWFLNRRADQGCVFLSPEGRCRIHERHGYEAKPLACRLFPFVLVPVADHWRVGLRFACPSAAASIGRPLAEHITELDDLAAHLVQRERLQLRPDGSLTRPPRFDTGQDLDWSDLLSLVDRFLELLRDRRDAVELRWRKCLALVDLLRQTRLDQLSPDDRGRTLALLTATGSDTARDPRQVPAPNALGRVIFRLVASLYTRKDHGPNSGIATRGRLALLGAVLRFARGAGPVPRMNRMLPETTFEQAEEPRGPLSEAAEQVLERYYAIKVGSFQFCGPLSFGLSFREGLEALAVTVPLILWVMRLFRNVPQEQAAVQAISIVDDHFGYNPLLASRRLRLGLQTLARRGELARLIAWYSR